MSSAVRVQALVSFHQPIGNSQATTEQAVATCYVPLLDALAKHPRARISLHFGGALLDFFARNDEALLLRLRKMVQAGQVEILGGPFYGTPAALIRELDFRGQVEMSAEYWASVLGKSPRGGFMSELSWSLESPRMVQGTGLEYGFAGSSQLRGANPQASSFGLLERGGCAFPVFVCDSPLSAALPARPVGEWVDAVVDKGCNDANRLVTTWVRAESLGLEPNTHAWCHRGGWLENWLAALSENDRIESVLPSATFDDIHQGCPLRLIEGCAAETGAYGLHRDEIRIDWADFPTRFSEVDTLHRRMLRASDRLRESIGIMQDEELEEAWSDGLATVQRHVFKAQCPDAYFRGALPGFCDPANRDGAFAEIAIAESSLDRLQKDQDEFLSLQVEDRDGDSISEVFAANAHAAIWAVPAWGAAIRTFDHRHARRNIFDVPTRRVEPFAASMERVTDQVDAAGAPDEILPPAKRGSITTGIGPDAPMRVDSHPRLGMRSLLLSPSTAAADYFAGTVEDLGPRPGTWQVIENALEPKSGQHYCLRVRNEHCMENEAQPAMLSIEQSLRMSAADPTVVIEQSLQVTGVPAAQWATEIPVRLGADSDVLAYANGEPISASTDQELSEINTLRFVADDGTWVEISYEPALRIWLSPIRTHVKTLSGVRSLNEGLVALALLRAAPSAQAKITMSVGKKD